MRPEELPPPDSMSKNPIESVSLFRILVRADDSAFDTSRGVLVLVLVLVLAVLLMLCRDLVLDGRNAEEQGAVARRLAMQRDERRVKRSIDLIQLISTLRALYCAISVFMRYDTIDKGML